ncbi:MAG: hypothetical protein NTY51_03660 [Deltaproteobacteria bacterium]|nr:hypothetical protein [Deltaproteobacteria bacterium]
MTTGLPRLCSGEIGFSWLHGTAHAYSGARIDTPSRRPALPSKDNGGHGRLLLL